MMGWRDGGMDRQTDIDDKQNALLNFHMDEKILYGATFSSLRFLLFLHSLWNSFEKESEGQELHHQLSLVNLWKRIFMMQISLVIYLPPLFLRLTDIRFYRWTSNFTRLPQKNVKDKQFMYKAQWDFFLGKRYIGLHSNGRRCLVAIRYRSERVVLRNKHIH